MRTGDIAAWMHGRLLFVGCVAATVFWAIAIALSVNSQPLLADTPRLQIETGGHVSLVRSLQVTGDGKWLISASDDKTVRIWNVQTGRGHRR